MERRVLIDTRIVDERIESTPGVERRLQHPRAGTLAAYIVVLRDGLATARVNFRNDRIRTGRSVSIIDDDTPTQTRQMQSIGAPESSASPGDDDDTTFTSRVLDHGCVSLSVLQ